ncbi:hypothetical protein CBR_g37106 [Chara braunii]|uniref:Reverse transcriptase domain-containing protein n=1 Tax=Chara braunii TaxID=69332 RepID=A0A388LMH1_CHABU|nr:hypothetical protein CBR_g37106 [Chara braunii]|eukprot:GBG83392.1 hypothetical protein CBR_g37106 [Chara braunii]
MNVTFQNFVNKARLTQGMINFCIIVYMDDILVYSETYHGHAQHIERTLGAMRDVGFKIALEKREFFLSEILFLGYVVTRGGLRPDSRKVEAVKNAPVPTPVTLVRAFMGLASYYRRLIKGFIAIARPMTNLLRKDQPLSWDAECEQAFATLNLKGALAAAPILIRSDPTKQFILITDWQPEAISAILAQKGNNGREHVIEYVLVRCQTNEGTTQPHKTLFLEIDVTNLTVWDPIIGRGNERQEEEGEENEEEESSEDSEDPDYIQEEEEDREGEEPTTEEEGAGGPSQQPEGSREEEEARARKRLEKTEEKRPVEERSLPDLSLGNLWLDPEPPKEDEGNDGTGAEGSGRRSRRSESPTSSGSSARPALRLRQHEGDRASSPFVLFPSP